MYLPPLLILSLCSHSLPGQVLVSWQCHTRDPPIIPWDNCICLGIKVKFVFRELITKAVLLGTSSKAQSWRHKVSISTAKAVLQEKKKTNSQWRTLGSFVMNWLIYSVGRTKSKLALTISSQQKITQNELSVEEKPVVLLRGNCHTHNLVFLAKWKQNPIILSIMVAQKTPY